MFTQRELDNYAGPVYRRGLEEGAARSRIEIARAMLAKGYDVQSILDLTGIDMGQEMGR